MEEGKMPLRPVPDPTGEHRLADDYPNFDPSRVSLAGGEPGDENEEGHAEPPAAASDSGGLSLPDGARRMHCLTVIGQVEGHYTLPANNKTTKYEHIIPQLISAQQDPGVSGLLIVLNTVGGDVEAGLAIAELIAGMTKPTVSLVLGGGHSIGVPLAVAADCSFIVPSATMTIHPVRMNGPLVWGPQTGAYFDSMQDRITRFVCGHSGISPKRFTRLLHNTRQLAGDVGTVLDGEKAVSEGLIDRLGGLSDAIAELRRRTESD